MGHDTEMRRLRGFGDTNFVLLARDPTQGPAAHAPLPEVVFSFEPQGEHETPWKVRHFTATEGLSTVYECTVDVANETLTTNPDTLLGRYAVLELRRDPVARRFFGVIRRVEHRGTGANHRLARVFMVPALWTLSQRSDARIFQDMTAVEVVQAVLRDAGLYVGMIDLQLLRAYPKREYCVQYRETDLEFVLRLLASEGVTFFFRHNEDEGETLVLADGAHAWGAVSTMDGGAIPIAGAEVATHRLEAVRHLTWERELRPTGVLVRDFDFTRPDFKLERMAPRRRDGERALYEPAPGVTLGQYEAARYARDDAQDQAQLHLEAERVAEAVGSGDGVVTGMIPGGMFQLTVAGAHVPPQRYVTVSVEHEGHAPEELTHGTQHDPLVEDRYRNRFRCVPVEVPYRPSRRGARPSIAGLQTATVVGPASEEVYTDEHGRIRVQFHWDRLGSSDEHSACWMRVIQGPWAGSGWGFQFIPRIGMEVAISFIEGDPDRPVAVGSLYNGRNGAPFTLPSERTRSGVRTQTVGGGGNNELSFEDGAGSEQVYLHAQRNHDEVVENDHSQTVRNDQHVEVSGQRVDRVVGDEMRTVHANRVTRVDANATETVGGNRDETVQGNESFRVLHDQTVRVEGRRHDAVREDEDRQVGGHARRESHEVTETVHGGRTERIEGSSVLIVGTHEHKKSFVVHVEGLTTLTGSGPTEVASDTALVLRVGDSAIKITSGKIELHSKAIVLSSEEATVTLADHHVKTVASGNVLSKADKIKFKSSGASILLDGDAKIDGGKVKLGVDTSIDDDDSETTTPTTIELQDKDGHPLPNQRYVIVMGDGTERSGVLNAEGKATLMLDADARIRFPDLVEVEKQ